MYCMNNAFHEQMLYEYTLKNYKPSITKKYTSNENEYKTIALQHPYLCAKH